MAISDFILARIAEDEALAGRAIDGRSVADQWDSESDGEHFNQWNPWRVQSACITRRLIVRAHMNTGPAYAGNPRPDQKFVAGTCRTCRDERGQPAAWPCYTLRVLASEWSHHPDYRNEWRPTRSRVSEPVPATGAPQVADRPHPPGQRSV